MPKKMTPKSQAKNKTPISIIPIFSYFLTLKRVMQTNIIINHFARFKHKLSCIIMYTHK